MKKNWPEKELIKDSDVNKKHLEKNVHLSGIKNFKKVKSGDLSIMLGK